MTALNGLTRPWESFTQTLCARKESIESLTQYGKIAYKKKLQQPTENLYSEKIIRVQPPILKVENNQTSRRVIISLQRRNSRRRRRITQSINATTVIRQDILLENVHHQRTTTTKDIMLIQLKMRMKKDLERELEVKMQKNMCYFLHSLVL